MTKRICESGTITLDPNKETDGFPVVLITEGKGSSADFPREFFTQANADALAGSLSFSAHPVDLEKPNQRDPLSAIATIGNKVVIAENAEGLMEMRGRYHVAKSKPQIAEYLAEFGPKLGLSIYADSEGHTDTASGRWVAESLDGSDPYKSVDLVVAAGRGGKFEKVAEALGLLPKASATAGEEEVSQMEIKEVGDAVVKLTQIVEGLVSTLEGKAKADLQVEADTSAVTKAVEGRLSDYDKAVTLISEAKLTESQTAAARALALKGEDVAPFIEDAKKVLAEAKALAGAPEQEKIVEHLGGGKTTDADFSVPGFGKVS